ncbi:MAG: cell division protein FtsZ [Helicobacteraceae bacterium]|jgi:cell division protein FtsZ|nr:cell division protein FtsZ [Helicobacteraceae bacterium]
MDDLFTIEESMQHCVVNIKVIGVGGGGNNMVDHMAREGLRGIEIIAANTDAQHLATSLAAQKLQLGEKLTKGLGAGMKPQVGKEAAEESYDEIREILKGAQIVFVATGLGGGTGTGASSVVARAAKENGSMTIAVCTMPFLMEGTKRTKLAKEGFELLKQECDSVVLIQNDKLLSVIDKNLGYAESLVMVDAVLARAVRGISSIVLPSRMKGIKTDFADLSTVMSHKGTALMGMGYAKGADSAYEALKEAVESPLVDNLSMKGSLGVLVNFQFHPAYPLTLVQRAMQQIRDDADEDADVFFGTSIDDKLEQDEAYVTIIATGFERQAVNNTAVSFDEAQRQRPVIHTLSKAVGDYESLVDNKNLDVPAFIRRQVD